MSEEEKQIHLYMHSKNELGLATLCVEKDKEIERLNKENTILRQNSQYLVKQKDELEEVINNAIEYLTDEGVCILNKGMKENERLVWTWENYYDLLNILKGVDKE